MIHVDTDVLVIGAGGAGMYAALAAARAGASVLLADRALIGRGGATVMAQMTVAAAMGEECPDHWTHHLADTLAAGRGLCDPALARLLCEAGPERIREMDGWKTGWARRGGATGPMRQVMAPGHDRARCVYVDFLNTGPAVSKALRVQLNRVDAVRRVGDLMITDLVVDGGEAVGAVGMHLRTGEPVTVAARATVIATGGLTRLYRRNSASANMAGDGYALALRAGAELIDMEFVQFFPIGHLAPRLIGMDPIMWDPFRYKLGGRLTNAAGEEIGGRDTRGESDKYVLTRDEATWAIVKEVEAGRGSPAGGAWLSFRHLPQAQLRAAFGPVIDRLAKNGIDLTQQDVEVAPIAHYHMGGVKVDARMATGVPGLFAAGEAVGGANGANRLSGNAITEALVFGERAGAEAAGHVRRTGVRAWNPAAAAPALDLVRGAAPARVNTAATIAALQDTMTDDVGPFRTDAKLRRALVAIDRLAGSLGDLPPAADTAYGMERLDWFDLRNMLPIARIVAQAALARAESRGAHQREDHPGMVDTWRVNQVVSLRAGMPDLRSVPVAPAASAVQA
jgi:succinate dehydrogenase / fumarate reductase flavoprotein subunit